MVKEDIVRFNAEKTSAGLTDEDFLTVRKKKQIDPNIPKRPMNAYFLYAQDAYKALQSADTKTKPDKGFRTTLSLQWKEMSETDPKKNLFTVMADEMKKTWDVKKEIYMKTDTRKNWESKKNE